MRESVRGGGDSSMERNDQGRPSHLQPSKGLDQLHRESPSTLQSSSGDISIEWNPKSSCLQPSERQDEQPHWKYCSTPEPSQDDKQLPGQDEKENLFFIKVQLPKEGDEIFSQMEYLHAQEMWLPGEVQVLHEQQWKVRHLHLPGKTQEAGVQTLEQHTMEQSTQSPSLLPVPNSCGQLGSITSIGSTQTDNELSEPGKDFSNLSANLSAILKDCNELQRKGGFQNIGCHQTVIMQPSADLISEHSPEVHIEETHSQPVRPRTPGSNSRKGTFSISEAPTAVSHWQKASIMTSAYAIISSFIFVVLLCWWSIPCTSVAIALGAASHSALDAGDQKLAKSRRLWSFCCLGTAWISAFIGMLVATITITLLMTVYSDVISS